MPDRSQGRRWTKSALLGLGLLLAAVSPAAAAITPTTNDAAGAGALAQAITANPANVTGASFDAIPPSGTPNGVGGVLSSFPTNGSTFGILTSGDVNFADDPNTSGSSTANNGGGPVRGDSDRDVVILKLNLNVPTGANCLSLDFKFLSEEYPEFVGTGFNDAFIAELDSSTWTTSGSAISAPNNFAFDPSGSVVSINSTGATSFTAAEAAGTTYDGGTPLLAASKQVTPGAHVLYLSIFDQGDNALDSAVFLDNLVIGFVPDPAQQCKQGAVAKPFGLTLSPLTATNPVGTSHTVTAALTEGGAPAPGKTVAFTVTGANPTTGTGTTLADGTTTFTYTGTNAGNDTIVSCFDADANGTCGNTGDPLASATKTWVAADTTPPTCGTTAVRRAGATGHDQQDVTVKDGGSGLKTITNIVVSNGTVFVSPFTIGTTGPVILTATKTTQGVSTKWSFDATDVAGNVKHCV